MNKEAEDMKGQVSHIQGLLKRRKKDDDELRKNFMSHLDDVKRHASERAGEVNLQCNQKI